MFKIESKFRKCKKKIDKIFFVSEIIAYETYEKVAIKSLLRGEYMLSAVKWLTKSPKILYLTQRDFFNMKCLYSEK